MLHHSSSLVQVTPPDHAQLWSRLVFLWWLNFVHWETFYQLLYKRLILWWFYVIIKLGKSYCMSVFEVNCIYIAQNDLRIGNRKWGKEEEPSGRATWEESLLQNEQTCSRFCMFKMSTNFQVLLRTLNTKTSLYHRGLERGQTTNKHNRQNSRILFKRLKRRRDAMKGCCC